MLRHARRAGPQIQLTSFVDILFNLLAFILVVGSLERAAPVQLRVELPRPTIAARESLEQGVELVLDRQGRLWLEGFRINLNELAPVLWARRGEAVVLRADRRLAYELIIEVLAVVRESGYSRVRLVVLSGGGE